MSFEEFLSLTPPLVITIAFGVVAIMVRKFTAGRSAGRKPENADQKKEPLPPPIGEVRVMAEMWDVLIVLILLLVNAGLMIYAFSLDRSDPRQLTGLMWTTVASLALAGYVVWRVHLLINRTK